MNIAIQFPSQTPGAIVDLKKGRAQIAFTAEEMGFVMNLFTLLSMTPHVGPTPTATPLTASAGPDQGDGGGQPINP